MTDTPSRYAKSLRIVPASDCARPVQNGSNRPGCGSDDHAVL